MRILMVHNRYRIRGGEDAVCDSERQLLQVNGHEVDLYEDFNDRLDELNLMQSASNTVWSKRSYDALVAQLSCKQYDVVHVHNFLPLISPSVYHAAKSKAVPVVQTLHNYRLLCPNALFFRDGKVCEDCLGKSFPWPGIYHGCYRKSRAATTMVATMNTIHAGINTWTDKVDAYIALTKFARQKYIEGGLPAEKIQIKPNFVDPDPGVGEGKGDYALYVGRLSVEKGIDVLLEAWKSIGNRLPLKIVGDGPLSELLIDAMRDNPSIEWKGRRSMQEVYALMGNAKALIFPSKWYETFGLVAIEAFATGTPVIAANIGAIAELITSSETGLLFEPSNSQSLVAQVDSLLALSPQVIRQMRQRCRQEFLSKYTAARNYRQLIQIYQQVIDA